MSSSRGRSMFYGVSYVSGLNECLLLLLLLLLLLPHSYVCLTVICLARVMELYPTRVRSPAVVVFVAAAAVVAAAPRLCWMAGGCNVRTFSSRVGAVFLLISTFGVLVWRTSHSRTHPYKILESSYIFFNITSPPHSLQKP